MKKLFYILGVLLLLAPVVHADETTLVDTFRCGSSIVNKGTQDFEVADKCGDPLSKEAVGYTDGALRLKIDKWVYETDSGDMRILYFKAGKLERIETYKPSN
jgi:hypothetical protein